MYNLGDEINPYLINKIYEQNVLPIKSQLSIMGIGSTLRFCNNSFIVWGTGLKYKSSYDEKLNKPYIICGVRGPITRKRLLDIGAECPKIYGDSALLLPLYYFPKYIKKTYILGIIPHISQYKIILKVYGNIPNVKVLDFRTNNVEKTIDLILSCSYIVSSGLHGNIISNAYNIPCKWIKFDNNIKGDDTKFNDHFESIGWHNEKPINAMKYKKININSLINQMEINNHRKLDLNINNILDACPFDKNGLKLHIIEKIIKKM